MILVLFLPLPSFAAWLNTSGKVTSLVTYATTNTILVGLSVDGADVAQCSNKTTFAISKDIDAEARARMYALLLAAKTADTTVVVSYQDAGGCEPWSSNPSVYRRIVRLQ
ncbi:hypothetical protein EYS14_10080 [Alteromonadaceae bacterium M269]|nr:hypothetical protein EYS14_10080 [Alteromonadaceae bacterium M269]